MATYTGSIAGKIKGDLGDYTFQGWKSLKVIRRKPDHYNDANTLVQQNNRAKFEILNQLGKMFQPLVNVGMKTKANNTAQPMTTRNAFVSVNKDNVYIDQNGDPVIYYPQLELSAGSLEDIGNGLTGTAVGTALRITWNKGTDTSRVNDKMYIAVRIEEIAALIDSIAATTRESETFEIVLPQASTNPINVWVFLRDPITGNVSPTRSVTITPTP